MLKIIFTASFIFLACTNLKASGDTVYYYGSNSRPVLSVDQARVQKQVKKISPAKYRIVSLVRNDGNWNHEKTVTVKYKNRNTQKISVKTRIIFPDVYTREFEETTPGIYKFTEYSGSMMIRRGAASSMIPLVLEDTVRTYYANRKISSLGYYRNNQLQWNRNWLKDGTEYFENLFRNVDSEPEYEYGDSHFKSYLLSGIYSSEFDISQVNDKVVLGWVIMETGELKGIHVVSGKIKGLNELLIKLVTELPGSWTPATVDGKQVRYYMTIPFNFSNNVEPFETLEFSSGFLIWD